MRIRELKVMSVLFLVVLGVVTVGLIGAFIMHAVNPAKPQTPAEHIAELGTGRDHSVTPHIPQLFNSSAKIETKWSSGNAQYDMSLLEAKPKLKEFLSEHADYYFVVTWYEGDKPSARMMIPFSKFRPDESASGDLVMRAQGSVEMPQSQYEKVHEGKSWDLNWGPLQNSKTGG